jgi:hypothetical protein
MMGNTKSFFRKKVILLIIASLLSILVTNVSPKSHAFVEDSDVSTLPLVAIGGLITYLIGLSGISFSDNPEIFQKNVAVERLWNHIILNDPELAKEEKLEKERVKKFSQKIMNFCSKEQNKARCIERQLGTHMKNAPKSLRILYAQMTKSNSSSQNPANHSKLTSHQIYNTTANREGACTQLVDQLKETRDEITRLQKTINKPNERFSTTNQKAIIDATNKNLDKLKNLINNNKNHLPKNNTAFDALHQALNAPSNNSTLARVRIKAVIASLAKLTSDRTQPLLFRLSIPVPLINSLLQLAIDTTNPTDRKPNAIKELASLLRQINAKINEINATGTCDLNKDKIWLAEVKRKVYQYSATYHPKIHSDFLKQIDASFQQIIDALSLHIGMSISEQFFRTK